MRRKRIDMGQVAELSTLASAFGRAALGKRDLPEVRHFAADLEARLEGIADELRSGSYRFAPMRRFEIHDPKRRTIHAPVFQDRVVHHALMAHVGPVLDRSLVADTFACRVGKGTHAAVRRAQAHSRRFTWFLKLDVRDYFGSIRHRVLEGELERKLKGPAVLDLCRRVIACHEKQPGRGLPIGSLTSQHFANFYLAGLDRLVLEGSRAGAIVRYMDDLVIWGHDRIRLVACHAEVECFALQRLGLELHEAQPQRSSGGLSLCGFRIRPHSLRLSPRRRKRYRRARQRWEQAFRAGCIDARCLQRGFEAALATVQWADSGAFRHADLVLRPAVEA